MSQFNDREDVERSHYLSRDARSHFEREAHRWGDRHGVDSLNRALSDATFNRGPLAGRTGDSFKDDPFFNPWAKGGTFDKD